MKPEFLNTLNFVFLIKRPSRVSQSYVRMVLEGSGNCGSAVFKTEWSSVTLLSAERLAQLTDECARLDRLFGGGGGVFGLEPRGGSLAITLGGRHRDQRMVSQSIVNCGQYVQTAYKSRQMIEVN